MRIGSLFSGAGGLDLAALDLFPGSTMAWHAEIDPAASRVLAHHWPDVPNLGSVTEIDWHETELVDVLCGGFPCQDVSAAGLRTGLSDGTRSGLWSHMAEAIDALRPRWVLIENVRGLLSAPAARVENHEQRRPCICGWIDRRRGVCAPLRERGRANVSRAGNSWDDDARVAGSAVAARGVGWVADQFAYGHRQVEFGVDVDGDRRRVEGSASVGAAVSETESVAGSSGVGGGANPDRLAAQAEWQRGMDLAGACRVRVDQGEAAPLERQGRACDECGGYLAAEPSVGHLELGPGALGDRRTRPVLRALGAVLGDLADLGFDAEWTCFRASEVGACHRRERVFILAWPADAASSGLASLDDGAGSASACGGGERIAGRSTRGDAGPVALLPTPRASDGSGGPNPLSRHERMDDVETRVIRTGGEWGEYAAAICRHEDMLGRLAPAAIEQSRHGNPRLSPAFAEWMMMWPAGWATDPAIALSRNEQLRIIGNGVVPRQAAAAFRHLLDLAAVNA